MKPLLQTDPTREEELVRASCRVGAAGRRTGAEPPEPSEARRAELSDARDQLTAAEKEREELRAECERLRSEETTAPAMPAVLSRRYEEIIKRLDALGAEVEHSTGKDAPDKGGWLSRLTGRGGQPTSSDVVPIGRRLDTLRIDAAVERERALRIVAEAARAYAEKQLADAQAMLRERGEAARRQSQRPEDAIPHPLGAKAPSGHQ